MRSSSFLYGPIFAATFAALVAAHLPNPSGPKRMDRRMDTYGPSGSKTDAKCGTGKDDHDTNNDSDSRNSAKSGNGSGLFKKGRPDCGGSGSHCIYLYDNSYADGLVGDNANDVDVICDDVDESNDYGLGKCQFPDGYATSVWCPLGGKNESVNVQFRGDKSSYQPANNGFSGYVIWSSFKSSSGFVSTPDQDSDVPNDDLYLWCNGMPEDTTPWSQGGGKDTYAWKDDKNKPKDKGYPYGDKNKPKKTNDDTGYPYEDKDKPKDKGYPYKEEDKNKPKSWPDKDGYPYDDKNKPKNKQEDSGYPYGDKNKPKKTNDDTGYPYKEEDKNKPDSEAYPWKDSTNDDGKHDQSGDRNSPKSKGTPDFKDGGSGTSSAY